MAFSSHGHFCANRQLRKVTTHIVQIDVDRRPVRAKLEQMLNTLSLLLNEADPFWHPSRKHNIIRKVPRLLSSELFGKLMNANMPIRLADSKILDSLDLMSALDCH